MGSVISIRVLPILFRGNPPTHKRAIPQTKSTDFSKPIFVFYVKTMNFTKSILHFFNPSSISIQQEKTLKMPTSWYYTSNVCILYMIYKHFHVFLWISAGKRTICYPKSILPSPHRLKSREFAVLTFPLRQNISWYRNDSSTWGRSHQEISIQQEKEEN